MSANNEAIKARIRKLLNLAKDDGAAEQEADNALRFARKLMLENNVDETDLTVEEKAAVAERVVYGQAPARTVGRSLSAWESHLGSAVCGLFGTLQFYVGPKKHVTDEKGIIKRFSDGKPMWSTELVFYGPDEDARDATELYHEWALTIAAMARMKFNGALRGAGRSYCEGFATSLWEKVQKMRREEVAQIAQGTATNGCTALVVVNAHAVMAAKLRGGKQWLEKEQGIVLRSRGSRSSNREHHGDAYGAGRKDGTSSEFSRGERRKRLGGGQ